MQNDANINTPKKQKENKISSKNSNQPRKENNYQTEIKLNRIHRLSPSNTLNIPEEQSSNNNNTNYQHMTPSNKKKKKEIDEEIYKQEVEKEINKRKKIFSEFLKLYACSKINRKLEEENSLLNNENTDSEEDKKENINYYIINRTWFNQFKNYCKKNNITYDNKNEDYPGQINNQHLILQDDSCLKLKSENRIIINSKYLDNCTCVSQDIWNFLINICGGGPEIKYLPYRSKNKNNINEFSEITTIKKAIHVNLIFIPKKQIISNKNNKEPSNNIFNPLNPFQCLDIKKILKNIDSNNKIRKEKIYFDANRNVKELMNYINLILNQHRDKFTNTPMIFGLGFNTEENNELVENINYRLWILYANTNDNEIVDILQEQINKYEDADFLLNFTQINNNAQNVIFFPYLLNNFIDYKVGSIFPNKYTKNFSGIEYYNKIEDNNSTPVMNILIEEFPYHFDEPKKVFVIRKCSNCNYRDYLFKGCLCEKVFYCSEECRKKNMGKHMLSCKIMLYNFLLQRNESLYRIILGRKEYFNINKVEKEKFPILGLTNLGNSCYMNSALQCLFATKELSEFFLYNFDEKYINKDNVLGTGGILTLAYINLLLMINNTTNNRYITPDNFKIILGKYSQKFEGNDQEDAHEFINYLLDIFHEDLNRVNNKSIINKNNNINIPGNINITEEEKSIIEWNNFLKRNQSVLVDLFYGQLKSSVTCPDCGFQSVNFNSFLSLELSINQNKDYQLINIEFIDYYKESSNINFNILLYNNEKKIYFLRKKIANLLNIDLLSFELAIVYSDEIIHLFDLNDEIKSYITNIVAFRINPEFFYSENNGRYNEIINNENNNNFNNTKITNKYLIDFENLEYNVNKRRNEIIQYNENNKNINISDDFLQLNLLYNDNLGLSESIYHRAFIASLLIKNRQKKILENDEIIYIEKNKSCQDLYFQIFRKYFFVIGFENNSTPELKNKYFELYKSYDYEKINKYSEKLFYRFFKGGNFRPSDLNLENNFPDCPFILILQNKKYNVNQVIPISKDIKYFEVLNIFHDNIEFEKNKYNQLREFDTININSENNNTFKNDKNINNNISNNNNIDAIANFSDYIDNLLNENNNTNNNDNNSSTNNNNNNRNINQNKGLKGGREQNNNSTSDQESGDSENENEGSEETDNNDNDENQYDENDENYLQNYNSDRELNAQDGLESLSYSSIHGNSSPSRSPRKKIDLEEKEIDILLNLKTERDKNMDKLTIVWNPKYLKKVGKLTDVNLYDICDKIYQKSTNKDIKLEKLLSDFSKEEKLDKDNLYKCNNCNEESEANKKIEIYHVPKILIIHLKRFNNNKKINTFIDYPLTDLDINKYIKSNDRVSKYDLFGVINHFGSLNYGHYTSYCLNYHDNNWYEYNDRIVNKITKLKEKDTIVNKDGYILFYRSKDNDHINWDYVYKKEFEIINEKNMKKFGENLINVNEINDDNQIIVEENSVKDTEITDNKNNLIILEENNNNMNKNIDTINEQKEIDDDNFSFKEGMNNKSIISNITYENDANNNNENNLSETPKFRNKINIIDINENNNLLNFNLDKINEVATKEKEKESKEIDIEKKISKTEIKKVNIQNGIKISNNNTFRIMTFIKPRKKEKEEEKTIEDNKDKNNEIIKEQKNNVTNYNLTNNINTTENENELLKYNIFNQSRNYFKKNPKKSKKGISSVKNKELNLFFLKEISDNTSHRVPRSKKLYDELPLNEIKEKSNKESFNNINKKDENIKDINKREINLEDYVYNPFRNSMFQLKKF